MRNSLKKWLFGIRCFLELALACAVLGIGGVAFVLFMGICFLWKSTKQIFGS
jgi:hypothetical protein